MSTPRTELQFNQWDMADLSTGHKLREAKNFARQLETELNEAKARIAELESDSPWIANGETKEHWMHRQRQKYQILEQRANESVNNLSSAEADAERLANILRTINLSPCNGGSCEVATQADGLIESAIAAHEARKGGEG